MHREYHRWYTGRLDRDMGVVVYGHWGTPVLAFPTSGGDEWEFERQGMIDALGGLLEHGRIKLFCVGSNSDQSFYNRGAHPFHRSWMQRQWDDYVRREVVPFIHGHCQGLHPITTIGASLGAYHAANTLFRHPDVVSRCIAMSGLYDLRSFMDGHYDDNFYFNNPIDYLGGISDPGQIAALNRCEIRIVTGHGPWEHPEHSYALSRVLGFKGIRHHLDDWGADGGHDWPYWRRQAWEYLK
ncbi:MAG TPA: alpha/beta hydrolase-fold protein [Vicinamibacterales bacterium]